MAVDKLVDSTKLDNALDATADAIRAKTGGSNSIAFDLANETGFASAVAAIPSGGGTPTVTAITAVYSGGNVKSTDDLDSLKANLTVTASISNSLNIDLDDDEYTLSGTLAVGTATITVTYNSLTTTFTVTVVQGWDYVWTYADGKLTDNGWTMYTPNNNGTETLTVDGVAIYNSDASSYVQITPTNALPNAGQMSQGIMEVVFSVDAINNGNGARIRLSNGTNGIQTLTTAKGSWIGNSIFLLDNTTAQSTTARVAAFRTGIDHKIKLTLTGSTANVWYNDVLIYLNYPIANIKYASGTGMFWQGVKGTLLLKSIKFLIERT